MIITLILTLSALALLIGLIVLQSPLRFILMAICLLTLFTLSAAMDAYPSPLILMVLGGISEAYLLYVLYTHYHHQIHGFTIKAIIDELPEGICFTSLDGTVILMNAQMQALMNLFTNHPFYQEEVLERFDDKHYLHVHEKIYHYTRRQLAAYPMIEIMIHDVTETYKLNQVIINETEALAKSNEDLQAFQKQIDAYVRQKEVLAAKMHLHDDLSQCLLAVRAYFYDHAFSPKQLKTMWQETMIMMNQSEEKKINLWCELLQAASFAGVDLIKRGEFPFAYETLCMDLIHHCLSGLVFHQKGIHLYIQVKEEGLIMQSEGRLSPNALSVMEKQLDTKGTMKVETEPYLRIDIKWRNI